jgi:hypothetical protein
MHAQQADVLFFYPHPQHTGCVFACVVSVFVLPRVRTRGAGGIAAAVFEQQAVFEIEQRVFHDVDVVVVVVYSFSLSVYVI